jgi:hypothetical protein
MARLTNTFSWSLSRQQMFDECRRQYYLYYYRAWGGWEDGAEPAARLPYRLKQIVTLEMWIGDILHRLIQNHMTRLQRGFRPMAQPLREQARVILNQEWRQSLDQRWRENPKHNRNLFEHYYAIGISDERRTELRDRLFTCLDHFCALPLLDRLVAAEPDAWLAVEQLDTFLVDRVPVYTKIDCAARLGGQTLIIDWKSGRASDRDVQQVACYGLYAMQKWNVGFDGLRAMLVYLLENTVSEVPITADQALAMQERIVTGIQAMCEALADPAGNAAREEDFPMTDQRRRCRRCNFHEICYGPGPLLPTE